MEKSTVIDPVYQKLKSDAVVVLADLWRLLNEPTSGEDGPLPQDVPAEMEPGPDGPRPIRSRTPGSSGLCYFHLN